MTERRVRFTETALEHVEREHAWWREHRDHQEMFRSELDLAIQVAKLLPGTGSEYAHVSISGLRRLYLRKIGCHLYYTFDEREVIIRALWGPAENAGRRLSDRSDRGRVQLATDVRRRGAHEDMRAAVGCTPC